MLVFICCVVVVGQYIYSNILVIIFVSSESSSINPCFLFTVDDGFILKFLKSSQLGNGVFFLPIF